MAALVRRQPHCTAKTVIDGGTAVSLGFVSWRRELTGRVMLNYKLVRTFTATAFVAFLAVSGAVQPSMAVTVNASQSAEGTFDFSSIPLPYNDIVFIINGGLATVVGDYAVTIYNSSDTFLGSVTLTIPFAAPTIFGQSTAVATPGNTDPKGSIIISAIGNTDFDFTSLLVEVCVGNNNCSHTFDITNSLTATPLPAALPLFASGLGALGLLGWRRKRKAQAA
jgi:hypothetical protein